jgi:hypothetical protein
MVDDMVVLLDIGEVTGATGSFGTENFFDNWSFFSLRFSFKEETSERDGFFSGESLLDFHNRNGLSMGVAEEISN